MQADHLLERAQRLILVGPVALHVTPGEAAERAVATGAGPATVEVVELDEVPLTYLPSNAILIRAKAAGGLASL